MQTISREYSKNIIISKAPPGSPISPPHLHETIECLYLYSGNHTAYLDGKKYEIHAGDFFLVFPNHIHAYENMKLEHDGFIVMITASRLSHYKHIFTEMTPVNPICTPNDDSLLELMDYVYAEAKKGTDEKILETLITAFLGKLLKYYELTDDKASNDRTTAILNYCSTHFREDISIETLAKEFYLSRNSISLIFNKKLCISFNDHLNSLRISEFISLLDGGKHTITSAAISAGFSCMCTFNRAFKKQYGITPSEYLSGKSAKKNSIELR